MSRLAVPHQGTPSAHQRKAFWVKGLAGASSVVCPCIAVMGMGPSSVGRLHEDVALYCGDRHTLVIS